MTQDDLTGRGGPGKRERRDLRFGLEEALDGELPEEMVQRMQRHTDDCPECAEEWEQVRRMKELVRRSCADRAPSELRERIAVQCRTVSVTRTDADGTTVRLTRTETVRRGFPAP
ncbi:mycothiol system anti-sigma-R factor [Brachybacterium vulturis]|uniref:Mycothiol system anti-sigma-R factor n=1 Tax=Brachybacterium vulturis TaxID=2017484 RepID=A0A291GN99_9MICO|nr:mycothiol system anti-sigma-R factor [Brachybacterium vulturis]ATG51678.1 mycothiol system anti-sigma-R factor [Brachybacterium vulturis]